MTQPHPSEFFGPERAETYEARFAKLAALRDALLLVTGTAFHSLPDNARILCAGAGTGLEILDLARYRPGWTFYAVEPAPAILDKCRIAVATAGMGDRCTFHEGFLDSAPEAEPFDAATALLVSHFILERSARQAFYAEIARRLRPDGRLVTAELVSDPGGEDHAGIMETWYDTLRYAGADEAGIEAYKGSFTRGVSLLGPGEHTRLIEQAGFFRPVPLFQAVLMRG
jgi:tRNA (cmo5U34)-methyltransferase